MKALFFTFLFAHLFCLEANGQTAGEWTWMKGSNSNATAVYGVQGVAAPGNTPPNPVGAAEWTDQDGNLWLYGGEWVNSTLVNAPAHVQDLWKYDISTNMWTWVNGPGISGSGFPDFGVVGNFGANTIPPGTWSYGHCCKNITWTDPNGDLWMTIYDIITFQSSSATGSSTWKYSIALNEWACMHKGGYSPGTVGISSPNNSPQPAGSSAAWVADDGNLWFFGHFGKMWMFDVTVNEWVCKHGTSTPSTGALGVYNPNNEPAWDDFQQHWKSDDGTFYMFGGANWSANANNNMWQYDPTINQWRIVTGLYPNNSASFTQDCTFDPSNHPSNMKFQANCWKDDCNRFYGMDEGSGGYIWCFDPAINQFAKVSGNLSAYGTYLTPSFGALGVSAPSNFPGSYPTQAGPWANINLGSLTPSWTDNDGNFWKMGSSLFETNALWRYVPDELCLGGPVNAYFTASSVQGCGPLTVNFAAVHTDNINNYNWDFGDLTVITDVSSLATPIYTFTDAGVYTVQLIVDGQPGCGTVTGDTAELIITVVDVPQLTVTEDTIICEGSSVPLEATGASTYTWSPSTALNTANGSAVSASPIIETTYYVVGDDLGCSAIDSVTVSIAPLPVLEISDTTMCLGNATLLNVSGADSYVWSPPLGLNTISGASVIANPLNTTTYTITGSDLISGCSSSVQMTISVEQVDVNVNSETLCLNNPFDNQGVLTASGANTYTWSPPAGLNTTTGNTVTSAVTQTTTYTVVGTTLSGCTDTAEAVITVVPAFEVTVNSGEICAGEELSLIANGAQFYSWFPDMGLDAITGSQVQSSPVTSTTYSVIGSVDGCLDTAYAVVTVLPNPDAVIFVTPNPVSSLNPEISASTPASNNTIDWQLDGTFLSNQESFTYVFPQDAPGAYSLQLISTNALGCADTAWVIVEVQEDFAIYVPNAFTPGGDEFNNTFYPVISNGTNPSQYSFEIYNRWGERIFTSNNFEEGWDGSFNGNLVQDGVYTWLIEFNEEATAKKHVFTGHVTLLR